MKIIGRDTLGFFGKEENKEVQEYFAEIDSDLNKIGLTDNYAVLTSLTFDKEKVLFLCYYITKIPDNFNNEEFKTILEDHAEHLQNSSILIQILNCDKSEISKLLKNPNQGNRTKLFEKLVNGESDASV